MDWNIDNFLGWDVPFDGGSKVFFFKLGSGERFELMVANPAYWTAEDKLLERQVFFIIHKNRFYRLEQDSEEEKNLIAKLTKAAGRLGGENRTNPTLLISLSERLRSRTSAFKVD